MSDVAWDGVTERRAERRAAIAATEQSTAHGTIIQVPLTVMIVGFATMILLQIAGLIGHQVLSGHQNREANRSERVDESLTCYVVKITQGADPKNLLFDCGFLELSPRRE